MVAPQKNLFSYRLFPINFQLHIKYYTHKYTHFICDHLIVVPRNAVSKFLEFLEKNIIISSTKLSYFQCIHVFFFRIALPLYSSFDILCYPYFYYSFMDITGSVCVNKQTPFIHGFSLG